ncbi:MAG TPA: hypothetical protein VGD91_00580, partial [Trebonia sp.]
MVPADVHDFFFASAGVAGALIGLLFVAISVAGDRLNKTEASAQVHRIRAYAALTAFTNALTVSLFALIPEDNIGPAATVVGIIGLLFVTASLVSLAREWPISWPVARDALFLVGMAAAFVYQLIAGLAIRDRASDAGPVRTIAILVVVSFLVGIIRAWELIGGPSIGFRQQVVGLVRDELASGHAAGRADGPAE